MIHIVLPSRPIPPFFPPCPAGKPIPRAAGTLVNRPLGHEIQNPQPQQKSMSTNNPPEQTVLVHAPTDAVPRQTRGGHIKIQPAPPTKNHRHAPRHRPIPDHHMTTSIRPEPRPVPTTTLKPQRQPVPQHPPLQPWHLSPEHDHSAPSGKTGCSLPQGDAPGAWPAQDAFARERSDQRR